MIDNFKYNIICYKRGKEKNSLKPVHFYRTEDSEKASHYFHVCVFSDLFSSVAFLEYNKFLNVYRVSKVCSSYFKAVLQVDNFETEINTILRDYDTHMFFKNEIKE